MQWNRTQGAGSALVLTAVLTGCGFLDLGGCAPKPVALAPDPLTGAPRSVTLSCGQVYEANGQTWYVTSVYLTDAAVDVLEPAGEVERATFPDLIEDPALYSLPGVDPSVALLRHAAGDDPKAFELLYPKETEPTADVCPFLEPEPAIPGDGEKPGTGTPAGVNYEQICGPAIGAAA